MNLIAFCGPKQVGKTTARNACSQLANYPVGLSFAGPIKRALRSMGFTHSELFDNKEMVIPGIGVTPRKLMQTLGTQWGRDCIDPDIWLKLFEREYLQQAKNGTDLILVDDVRYDNEARQIQKLGGTIIKLTSTVRCNYSKDLHSSEQGISSEFVSHTVVNDGDLQQLISDIKLLVIPILQSK